MGVRAVPIRFPCPKCGKPLKAPETATGKIGRCFNCQEKVTIPPPSLDDLAIPLMEEEPRPSPSPPRPLVEYPFPSPEPSAAVASRVTASSGESEPEDDYDEESDGGLLQRRLPNRWLYTVFALALVPLAFSLLSEEDDVEARVMRTLASHPEVASQIEAVESEDMLFALLPEHRIEGAHLAHESLVHWLYAALAAGLMLGAVFTLFPAGNATPGQTLGMALITATAGVFFLMVQCSNARCTVARCWLPHSVSCGWWSSPSGPAPRNRPLMPPKRDVRGDGE